MKKPLLLSILFSALFFTNGIAQVKQGAAETKLTTALCDCISKLDQSAITDKAMANQAFMDCFTQQADILMDVAAERNVEITDPESMKKVGTDIGANLLKQKCSGFMQLAMKMSGKAETETVSQSTTGVFKRIDTKGFNYIVIQDKAGSQKSFLWLREFPGSEKFAGATSMLNKKLTITWNELEVYLPAARGYFKVKEITAINVL